MASLSLSVPENIGVAMGPRSYLSGKYVIFPYDPGYLVLWDWVSESWTKIRLEGVNEHEVSSRTMLLLASHSSDFMVFRCTGSMHGFKSHSSFSLGGTEILCCVIVSLT